MDISKMDSNFLRSFSLRGMRSYDVNEAPLVLYGHCRKEGEQDFKRLPHELVKTIDNPSVQGLYKNTSGIRVRFRTDSQGIVLRCILPECNNIPNMAMTGVADFSLYADGEYCNAFRPGIEQDGDFAEAGTWDTGYTSGHAFREKKMRNIVVFFPLYNDVNQVLIDLEEEAQLLPPEPYGHSGKVVFYGNSITQGACASHPGSSYCNLLSRWLDTDIVNLGFSAGAWGELALAKYIGHMDMSVLVMDYDHNAPTFSHLQKTHKPFYERVRSLQPDFPIIFVSAADRYNADTDERRQVILDTYHQALAAGDQNVYFANGGVFYREFGRDHCLADYAHPNDLEFWCMAKAIGKSLLPLLK